MFLETIKSEGVSHLSYLVGDAHEAAVIDPRRDCQIYIDKAHRQGARIAHVFETHRNEDYIIGSQELKSLTGATIHHGSALDFAYGEPLAEGDSFEFGNVKLRVLETPGHTFESISLALYDTGFGDDAVAVFTGDALFIGDVGRTDFFPDRKQEVAGLLYDSIFDKLLPLGDQTILCPAHGAGSVCGSGMAKREFSTLGYERRFNPRLQLGRDEFIAFKVNENHYKPPYFKKMEEYNQHGNAPDLRQLPKPAPMDADAFARAMEEGMIPVDLRSPEGFAGAFIPGSIALPLHMASAFAGWFLSYDKPLGLIVRDGEYDRVETAVRYLTRLGYDRIDGFLAGGLHEWETSGRSYDRIPTVHVRELQKRLDDGADFTLLDVRSLDEVRQGKLENARHIYLGQLPDRLDEVPKDGPVTTFCGSGQRAIIAASILKRNGFENVEDSLGSMSACKSIGCRIESVD